MPRERLYRWAAVALLLVAAVSRITASPYTAEKYIRDVESGRQVVCRWVKLAVERHQDDLRRAKRGAKGFPYRFDEGEAIRTIEFTQALRHAQGVWANEQLNDTHLRLEPWQQFIDWCVFGWRRLDGFRRFTHVYIEVAKKQGKTTWSAGTCIYCTVNDSPREIGAEAYCIATKKEQAKKAWDTIDQMVSKHPYLRRVMRTYRMGHTIVLQGTPTFIRLLGKDTGGTEHGMNPHFALVDEYHAHKDHTMVTTVQSATMARSQPLTWIITTAGKDKSAPCYHEEHALTERILDGSLRPRPEHVFGIIYTLDPGDDWADRKVWIKANPNLGVSVFWDKMEEQAREALASPTKLNDFLTFNLNIWTQAATRWIPEAKWMACAGAVTEQALKGRPCYVGLDLSATEDITAYCLCFPPIEAGGPYVFLWRFFMPEDSLQARERSDHVPYTYWRDAGLIIATPGDSVDYDAVRQELDGDRETFVFQELGYDPWNAQEMKNYYQATGLQVVEIRQTFVGMAAYTKTFEKKVLAREIRHDGNPVMSWMLSNTEVKSDRQDNIAPMKPKRNSSGKRIDGVVAAIMALGRAVSVREQYVKVEVHAG